jgi:hypothetical protein
MADETQVCPFCGETIPALETFCHFCGGRITGHPNRMRKWVIIAVVLVAIVGTAVAIAGLRAHPSVAVIPTIDLSTVSGAVEALCTAVKFPEPQVMNTVFDNSYWRKYGDHNCVTLMCDLDGSILKGDRWGILAALDCEEKRRKEAATKPPPGCQTPALQAEFVAFASMVKKRGLECRHSSINPLGPDDYEVVYQFTPTAKDTVYFRRHGNGFQPDSKLYAMPFINTMSALSWMDFDDAMKKK